LLELQLQVEGRTVKGDGPVRMGLQGLLPVDGLETRHLEIAEEIGGHIDIRSE
jgi:hypothetical protein